MGFLLSADIVCSLFVVVHKPFVLRAFHSVFDVECQWEIVKYVPIQEFVVLF